MAAKDRCLCTEEHPGHKGANRCERKEQSGGLCAKCYSEAS
jgi:hypothetical protein